MRRRKVLYVVFILIWGVTAFWGVKQYIDKVKAERYLEGQYQRSLYELIDHVGSIENDMAKVLVSNMPSQSGLLLSNIWREAYVAEANLTQLPLPQGAINNTAKFLTQVGDYSYALSKRNLEEKPLTQEELNNLTELHNLVAYLAEQLQSLHDEVAKKTLFFGSVRRTERYKLEQVSQNLLDLKLENIEKQMTNYPTLIYDGPFSAHLDRAEPKGLIGNDVSEDQAKNIVADFLGRDGITSITKYSNIDGKIPGFGFEIKKSGSDAPIFMHVSKKGGHVIWMLNRRSIGNVTVDEEKAVKIAQDFLDRKGFKDMVTTYKLKYDGYMLINFAYYQDGVVVYPDLIKVQVALDNGEIVGFEAQGYFMNHTSRSIPKPKITKEEAMSVARDTINIETVKLAIIPTESLKEILTYEIKGKFGDDTFYIYVNALTGKEEKILKVIPTENGELTM